jgi:hypothetical protein
MEKARIVSEFSPQKRGNSFFDFYKEHFYLIGGANREKSFNDV